MKIEELKDGILIVPQNYKRDALALKGKDPYSQLKVYGIFDANALFCYGYDTRALNHLLKEGYPYLKATKILSNLSFSYGKEKFVGDCAYLNDIKDKLLELGYFYIEPHPERLFDAKPIYFCGFYDTFRLKPLMAALGRDDFVEVGEKLPSKIPEVYSFEEPMYEAFYVLNRIARLIEEGTPGKDIVVYGANDRLRDILLRLSPDYGFRFKQRTIPLYQMPLFAEFMSLIDSDDKETLKDLSSKDLTGNTVRVIALLVACFEGLDLARRKELYNEASHGIDVYVPIDNDGVTFQDVGIPAPNKTIILCSANLGSFPKSQGANQIIDEENLKILGLPSLEEENLNQVNEARGVLTSAKVAFVTYSRTNGKDKTEPSFLIASIGAKITPDPILNYEYSHSKNGLLQALLQDEFDRTKKQDGRLGDLKRARNIFHGSFPYHFTGLVRPKSQHEFSFSSLKNYALCPFYFYCSSILRLDDFEGNSAKKYGNYLHFILEHIHDADFDLEKAKRHSYEKVEGLNGPFEAKEKALLTKINDLLPTIVQDCLDLDNKPNVIEVDSERKFNLQITDQGDMLTGRIDKLIKYQGEKGPCYAVYDYKSSPHKFDEDLFKGKGLNLQLPLYLYALGKEEDLRGYIAEEVGYKKVLPAATAVTNDGKEGWIEKKLPAIKKELKTQAISVAKDEDKDTKYASLAEQAGLFVRDMADKIMNSEFPIKPYVYLGVHSCQNCPFRDVCYRDFSWISYEGPKQDNEEETDAEMDV